MNGTANTKQQIDLNFDFDPNVGDGLKNGLNALGQVFGGLVTAIKDAVGPEMLKNLEAAGWMGQVAKCLETISTELNQNGSVPADAVGQLSYFSEQFSEAIAGSMLESQSDALKARLQTAQTAIDAAGEDPVAAAAAIAKVAGYFKAAAESFVSAPSA